MDFATPRQAERFLSAFETVEYMEFWEDFRVRAGMSEVCDLTGGILGRVGSGLVTSR